MTPQSFGRHYIVDLIGCEEETLRLVGPTRQIFLRAAKDCGATIVDDLFHQYQPFGVSGVVLIAESHLSIHTWPEHRFAGVDIFTCGEEMDADVAIEIMKNEFCSQKVVVELLSQREIMPVLA